MRKLFFTGLAALLLTATAAAQGKYASALIAEDMKKDAHVVIREEKIMFDVKSRDKALLKIHRVFTVLDEAGKDELFFYQFTDRFNSLEDVNIEVFDAKGKSVRSYSRSDLAREANPYELVPDGKVYYLNIPVPMLPATVRVDYEIKKNGLLNYPDYLPQETYQSVEHSEYFVKVPADLGLRYKTLNGLSKPVIDESDKKNISYTWTVSNMPVKEYEEGSGSFRNSFPRVMLSPNRFELDGYEGDMSSWKSLGLWYNDLVKTDNTLSPSFRSEILQLTAKAGSDKEKARLIYEFLQNNYRYVSIQLGIGGFKPFSADFVHRKKYGDCKALSNYMQACLSAVNIKSYSAWIKGDPLPNRIDPSFPKDDFNHQVLCIPFPGDTTWLECTSSTNDFGVLGAFTENRYGLLLTEQGGILVNTPKTRADDNHYSSFTKVMLNDDGSGKATATISSTGEFKSYFNAAAQGKKDEQKNFIVKHLEFIQPDAFEFKYVKGRPAAITDISLDLEKIPDFTAGSKFFLNPRIYKMWSTALPKSLERIEDYYLPYPQVLTDTTLYLLPDGFAMETLPKPRKLNFEYGSFASTYTYDADKKAITTTAKLVLNESMIPAARFAEAKKFFNDVLGEYQEKIVIKRL